jgi:hypothetical protein
LTNLLANALVPGTYDQEDLNILDAMVTEAQLLEQRHQGRMPELDFSKRPYERLNLTQEAWVKLIWESDDFDPYSDWFQELLRTRGKGDRIPEDRQDGFALRLTPGDYLEINEIVAKREKAKM